VETSDLNIKINNIISLFNLKKFKEANDLRNSIEPLLKKEINFYLQGLMFFFQHQYEKSIEFFTQSIKLNKDYLPSYLNLADSYDKLNELTKSEDILRRALILKYNSDIIHNSLGFNYFKQNKIKEAILCYTEALKINDNNFKIYFNLARAFIKQEKYLDAINCFNKTIEINRNCPDVYFNLGEVYKQINDIKSSLYNFKIALQDKITWLRREKIIAKIMELYFIADKKEEYQNYIKNLSLQYPDNRRISATSVFISNQFDLPNPHPFCPNPLDFIYKGSLRNYVSDYGIFLKSLMHEIDNLTFKWEPSGKTTRNGFGTTENLSDKNLPIFIEFEKLILKELNQYFLQHNKDKIGYIKNWPSKFRFQSWSNRLKKQGFNITHIHPSGWISGVFYLKIPKNIKDDEAGIEFSLHGDDYFIKNKDKIKTSKLQPADGDIIFFPSSLFHRTIPFNSDEERVCIAFDLCKT
jgi:uncharacterized protein (TIGR02466 family)